MNNIVFLTDILEKDGDSVGSKGLNLGRLIRFGFNVPPGFCVTVNVYKEFMTKTGLKTIIEAGQEEEGERVKGEEWERQKQEEGRREERLGEIVEGIGLDKIRNSIINTAMDDILKGEIIKAYRRLGRGRVAVRSSGNREDLADSSFAGQYDTFLDVEGEEELILAVKKCWASLWGERVFQYREKKGIPHADSFIVVVVQRMIPSEISGVLFTCNPQKGLKNSMIAESCKGLGEKLVSGRVSPDRTIIGKRKLNIIDQAHSDSNPILNEKKAKELGKIGLKAERLFGCSQDMEWGIFKNKIYIFQARPITTPFISLSPQEKRIWTNANTGEVLPHVASPLTRTMARVLIDQIFQVFTGKVGIDMREAPLINIWGGRIYFNLGLVLRLFRLSMNAHLGEVFGGQQERMMKEISLWLEEEESPAGINWLKFILNMPGVIKLLFFTPLSRGEKYIANLKKETMKLQQRELENLSLEELFIFFE